MAGGPELRLTKEAVETIKQDIAGYPTTVPDDVKLPDQEQAAVLGIYNEIKIIFEDINDSLNSLEQKLDAKSDRIVKLNNLLDGWKNILLQHKEKYAAAKQKSTSQEATLSQIQKIEPKNYDATLSIEGYGSAVLKMETWGALRKKKADAARCMTIDAVLTFAIYSIRCHDFKQNEHHVNIPYTGQTNSNNSRSPYSQQYNNSGQQQESFNNGRAPGRYGY